ncbi:MAG TPA: hypothetical protein VMX17_02555 [Candidatus Glassbacteria bacterium]|nr:hypothetical protein [Candidatus Glassbacteria bacterium]
MSKILNIVIKHNCYECPYCQYNENYYDEGYDCDCVHELTMENYRIVDAHEIIQYKKDLEKWEQNGSIEDQKPVDPVTIPDWCPLPNIEE